MSHRPDKMPGFAADASCYKTSASYQSVTTRAGGVGEQRVDPQLRAIHGGTGGVVGGARSVGMGFTCDAGGHCRCYGDDDCNYMFSTNVCDGKNASCYLGWLTGDWVCSC